MIITIMIIMLLCHFNYVAYIYKYESKKHKKGKEKTKSQELELNEVCMWREDEGTRSHKKIRMECNKKWKFRVG